MEQRGQNQALWRARGQRLEVENKMTVFRQHLAVLTQLLARTCQGRIIYRQRAHVQMGSCDRQLDRRIRHKTEALGTR